MREDIQGLVSYRKHLFGPNRECPWASEMVLNPAIIQDPETGRLHMLFRGTGPCQDSDSWGSAPPYPIFLGYAWSDDLGEDWTVDFDQPALAPKVAMTKEGMYIDNDRGEKTVNYANGCIEDPRLFFMEGDCYMIVACRAFPPGAYWIKDDPMQCAPLWSSEPDQPFGLAVSQNVTVSVLYRVNLDELSAQRYEEAFQYVTHLTNPEYGENRDVLLFPEKLMVGGEKRYVCIHRPQQPFRYPGIEEHSASIMICESNDLYEISSETESQKVLATPIFEWESNRVGASAPPLKISETEWLLSYHAKESHEKGYTQSFMILETLEDGLPVVKHRCKERIIYPVEEWEMPNKFKSPVIFICGMIQIGDELMISYGAADEQVGIASIRLNPLLELVRSFDSEGNKVGLSVGSACSVS